MALLTENNLELHYYFSDSSHDIDALVRNKCESELIAIVYEAASIFDIEIKLLSEPPEVGGFKEFWKALGKNSSQINVLLVALGVAVTVYISYTPEDDERKKTLEELQIKELKLRIKSIEKTSEGAKNELAQAIATKLSRSLKISKRRSNFYSQLNQYQKVSEISITAHTNGAEPLKDEFKLARKDFQKFILNTNKLKVQEDDKAKIEIISPVLKDGNYKWKGMYKEQAISFSLTDSKFRDSVIIDGLNFRSGTSIKCLLIIHRELDQVGEVKITGYSVPTVIEILDGSNSQKTIQGKTYLQAKAMKDKQGDMFS